ncbi:MAG: hypothetical protein PHN72_03350 [Bacilli bacterium]|nr:hypothetical protein [Bacilli bacterium]
MNPRYDFYHIFQWYEFQNFAKDMIQIREGINFHCNPNRKDKGVDFYSADQTIIGQVTTCKDFKQTLKKLDDDLHKYKDNNLRIIIVLSLFLDKEQRKSILTLFNNRLRDNDLIDSEDLNIMLQKSKYDKIFGMYMKLQIPNTYHLKKTIQETVHHDFATYNLTTLKKIENNKRTYIRGLYFFEAIELLDRNNSIIISGEPGIGKTAMALELIDYYLKADDYQLITLNNVNDFAKMYQVNQKQIFFFDDFWGNIQLDSNISNKDKDNLWHLLELVHQSENTLFILTTREYIFQDGIKYLSSLKGKYNTNKYLLRIELHDLKYKFEILNQHLVATNYSYEDYKGILDSWESIITHVNYTPRLIAEFFKMNYHNNVLSEFHKYLNDPYDYWKEIIDNLAIPEKMLLFILALEKENSLFNIKNTYNNLMILISRELQMENPFYVILSKIEQTFSSCYEAEGTLKIIFINPNYREIVLRYFKEYLDIYLELLFSKIKNFEALKFYLLNSEFMQNEIQKELIDYFDTFKEEQYSTLVDQMEDLLTSDFNIKYPLLFDYIYNKTLKISTSIEMLMLLNRHYFDSYPYLIKKVNELRPLPDIENIITLYYTETDTREDFEILSRFKVFFPQEFHQFVVKYKRRGLFSYIYEAIYDEKVELESSYDEIELDYLRIEAEKLFHDFEYKMPKWVEKELDEAYWKIAGDKKFIEKSNELWEDEKYYNDTQKLKKQIQKKVNVLIFKNEYLEDKAIIGIVRKKLLKNKRRFYVDFKNEYFRPILKSKQCLNVYIKELNRGNQFSNPFQFIEKLLNSNRYIKNNGSKVMSLVWSLYEKGSTVFEINDLVKYNLDSEMIKKVKWIEHKGRYFQFIHPYFYCYYLMLNTFDDKKISFSEILYNLFKEINLYYIDCFHHLVSLYDQKKYYQKIIAPSFYQLPYDDNHEVLFRLLVEYYAFEIEEANSSILYATKNVDIIGLMFEDSLIFQKLSTYNQFIYNSDERINIEENMNNEKFVMQLKKDGIYDAIISRYFEIKEECNRYSFQKI